MSDNSLLLFGRPDKTGFGPRTFRTKPASHSDPELPPPLQPNSGPGVCLPSLAGSPGVCERLNLSTSNVSSTREKRPWIWTPEFPKYLPCPPSHPSWCSRESRGSPSTHDFWGRIATLEWDSRQESNNFSLGQCRCHQWSARTPWHLLETGQIRAAISIIPVQTSTKKCRKKPANEQKKIRRFTVKQA